MAPVTLTAASYLGPNTAPILVRLVAELGAAGLSAEEIPPSDLMTDPPHLVWACGLLTAEVINDGGALSVVAAPVFTGETDAVYRSVVVTRADLAHSDLATLVGRRLAINEYGSWSGCRALARELELRGMPSDLFEAFSEVVVTGSHVDSVDALVAGRADFAAIDHTVWDHVCVTGPEKVHGLVVVDRTRDWPAPPFSVSLGLPPNTARSLIEVLTQLQLPGVDRVRPATIGQYRFMVG